VNQDFSKKILFVSGTRADFGKIQPLLTKLINDSIFEVEVFTTGMHMLSRYGSTWQEVAQVTGGALHPFLNQGPKDSMDQVLAKTISGMSDYIKERTPDLIVVHGDRLEALAGAIVGSLNNILVAHIEGGELSGTIDELLRHAISKLSHVHFVSNEVAAQRIIRMGENPSTVHTIGSPDIDVLKSKLPELEDAKSHYGLRFSTYNIVILHPVTTEIDQVRNQVGSLLEYMSSSKENFVVIESNNDAGSEIIFEMYSKSEPTPRIRFFPSMRFEYFLSLLKGSNCIIGNSSAGVREAPYFGVPVVNLGSRQMNRAASPLIINADFSALSIGEAVERARSLPRVPFEEFGEGGSSEKFIAILMESEFWTSKVQKQFID
jgi:UDP-N-acetylglucosamine 2-epimerase (hydrolysing)